MPFLLAKILNFQGSAHLIGVGSLSQIFASKYLTVLPSKEELKKLIESE